MKIFLVDDSVVFRGWLRKVISSVPGIELIGEARDPLQAVQQIRLLKPDTVILDMRARRRFGIDILQGIQEITPSPVTIVLTNKLYHLSSEHARIKADFLVDKFTERSKIPDILRRAVRQGKNMRLAATA
ncbi:MAG TPA: response regulator [Thermodesulfovibrionales bacterium]|jgi:chemotaxis response regulator CheB|nr:response regulator [Thermodesulfovibrionales bacterium]